MIDTRTDTVEVEGGSFDATVWSPEGGAGPGIVLIQEIFGVGPYIRAVGTRLAEAGYVVAAPDLFWRFHPHWEAPHDQAGLSSSMEMVGKLDFPLAIGDCVATLGHVQHLAETAGGTGVMGFCLGGTLAWAVAAKGDPACCVSYYGSGVPGMLDMIAEVSCPTLFHFGANDSFIPAEGVDALSQAIDATPGFELNVEAAGHAFDNHESEMFYDAAAAASAWSKTMAFLARTLPTG